MFWEGQAWAMAPPPGQGGKEGPKQLDLFWVIIPLIVVFWVFMILPQKKQQKRHQQELNALKKGDRVLTSGGVFGTVVKTEDNSVILSIGEIGSLPSGKKKSGGPDNTVNVRFAKAAISTILGDSSSESPKES